MKTGKDYPIQQACDLGFVFNHKRYGEVRIDQLSGDNVFVAYETCSEAGPYEDDQSICYGLSWAEVPISEIIAWYEGHQKILDQLK